MSQCKPWTLASRLSQCSTLPSLKNLCLTYQTMLLAGEFLLRPFRLYILERHVVNIFSS